MTSSYTAMEAALKRCPTSGALLLDHFSPRRQLHERVAEVTGDVGRRHGHFPFVGFRQVAGETVQIDRELARRLCVEKLCEPPGDHAGQNIPGPAGGHAGVARRVDDDVSYWRRDPR